MNKKLLKVLIGVMAPVAILFAIAMHGCGGTGEAVPGSVTVQGAIQ